MEYLISSACKKAISTSLFSWLDCYIHALYRYVGYLCRIIPDGIIKYDGFSTPQIDGTISKETILLRKDITSLDRLADSTAPPFATLQLLDYCLSHLRHSHALSALYSLPHPLPSSFLYPKVVLHLRVVG